jgi:hypothetical protein
MPYACIPISIAFTYIYIRLYLFRGWSPTNTLSTVIFVHFFVARHEEFRATSQHLTQASFKILVSHILPATHSQVQHLFVSFYLPIPHRINVSVCTGRGKRGKNNGKCIKFVYTDCLSETRMKVPLFWDIHLVGFYISTDLQEWSPCCEVSSAAIQEIPGPIMKLLIM